MHPETLQQAYPMTVLDTVQGVHKSQVLKAGGDAICLAVFISELVF